MNQSASIESLKSQIRREAMARRDALPAAERAAAAAAIAARALPVEVAPDAPEVFPDILIVPLLAFDRAGHRVGYGAGYYDMTIGRLRAMKPVIAVGIAYAAQEIAQVPATPRDAALDLVLTEREIIDLRKA